MAKLTTQKDYSAAEARTVRAAFSFLNEGSPATNAQIGTWVDRQIQAQVRRDFVRIESAKNAGTLASQAEGF
tara:strand:+ start:298 stop:513 length:216 start_codon:yes stop_codon:yes gene_type:complete